LRRSQLCHIQILNNKITKFKIVFEINLDWHYLNISKTDLQKSHKYYGRKEMLMEEALVCAINQNHFSKFKNSN
jgi:hypothetical protein